MELWVGALNLGFLYAFMTMGVYFTFRIHEFPDITVDGSFTTGAALAAVLMVAGVDPLLAVAAGGVIGGIAGMATAIINTRFRINGLLAGILVMTGLYSINLHIMGRSNIPLLGRTTVFSRVAAINPGMHAELWNCVVLLGVMVVFLALVAVFLKTDLGIAMRVTGSNPVMAAANGVNVDRMTIFGVALANLMVGVSGALVAQYQGFADIGMGIGTVVMGLAAVIIGESVLRSSNILVRVGSVVVGAVLFRFLIAIALYAGMNPIDLKLLTAAFVLATLVLSKQLAERGGTSASTSIARRLVRLRWWWLAVAAAVVVIAGGLWFVRWTAVPVTSATPARAVTIGVVQVTDNPLLNTTRDSLVDELARLGYAKSQRCRVLLENGNGDIATINSIVDKLVQAKADLIVAIGTAAAQAAINKVKDRPVVLATVANPFIIGAGKTDTEHLPNVVAVYGWAPQDRMLAIARRIKAGPLVIGAIWDPAHANSVFNVENLKKAVADSPGVSFKGATVTGSAEVYQAAVALVEQRIDAFVLPPDNIVYQAFEAIVKAAQAKRIPIFISDVERLQDGALAALGYDYTSSGKQAAALIARILAGAEPATLPFERYRSLTFGLNLRVARELGIGVPADLVNEATKVIGGSVAPAGRRPRVGIVQFALEPNVEVCKRGILDGLAKSGLRPEHDVDLVYKDAQADFSMINAIIQDFKRREVDIITPLSTPCLQAAIQRAGSTKVVFTYVYDPYRVGAAKTSTDHPATVTGIACFPPIEGMLDLIREALPGRRKIGVVWNSSEANSEAVIITLRAYAASTGVSLLEATVTNPAEVLDATRSLVHRDVDALLNSGDNTLNVGWDSFVKAANEGRIPVFSVDAEFIEKGALAVLGPDYYETGVEGGVYLARVLKGEDPGRMPIGQTSATVFMINRDVEQSLGLTLPAALVARAHKIIDSQAIASAQPTGARAKRLALFFFNENVLMAETGRGFLEEVEHAGLKRRYNLQIDEKNAQNDYAIAQSIAQDIVRQHYDYLVTFSTPALQIAAQFNKAIPHVFGAVTDPFSMGIAKTPADHLPQITGVATLQPVEKTLQLIRTVFPKARRIGMVWNPGEACSEVCVGKAKASAGENGFEIVDATVSGTSEVLDAVRAVLDRKVDVFFTSGDNTVGLAKPTIAKLLAGRRVPYVTNDPSDVGRGAFLALGADYTEVGRETARVLARVLAGEKPRDIPIAAFLPETLAINNERARDWGIVLPVEVAKRVASAQRPRS